MPNFRFAFFILIFALALSGQVYFILWLLGTKSAILAHKAIKEKEESDKEFKKRYL